MKAASWLPPAATNMAHSVDTLFYIMLGIVTFFFVLVEVLLVYSLIRYRRTKRNQAGAPISGNHKLEILWTLVPAAIMVALGAFCVPYVYALDVPPSAKYTVQVTGHEWFWEIKYPNGVDINTTSQDFELPAGQEVLFDITSNDVLHGFYIPAVRIQQDAVPGRRTQFPVNLLQSQVGQTFDVPCDQFCGVGHPLMVAHLKVVSESDFEQWLNNELKQQKSSQG